MAVYSEEKDQIEMLKTFWNEYGRYIVLALVIGAIVSTGWNFWQKQKVKQTQMASILYTQMQTAEMLKQDDKFIANATHLLKTYPQSPYASLASLALAKKSVEEKKYDQAVQQLKTVIEEASVPELKQIARIRMARILLAQKKTDEALAAITTIDSNAFTPLVNEIRGDIYVARGQNDKARQSYQAALDASPADQVNRPLLQMKFEQLSQQQITLAVDSRAQNTAKTKGS